MNAGGWVVGVCQTPAVNRHGSCCHRDPAADRDATHVKQPNYYLNNIVDYTSRNEVQPSRLYLRPQAAGKSAGHTKHAAMTPVAKGSRNPALRRC